MTAWSDDRSARERVSTVVRTVTEPVSVNRVAEAADVHWKTAERHLDAMTEAGDLRRLERDDGRAYVPDFTRAYVEEIRRLAVENSAEELREEVAAAKARIEEIRAEFGVESPDDLEASLTDPDCSAAETRARSRALRDWEQERDALTLLQHALSLQDDLRAVDPYAEVPDGDGDGPARSELV